jgi:hypothetical protein
MYHRLRLILWPVWGNGLGHVFSLVVTLRSGQVEWSATPDSHSFEVVVSNFEEWYDIGGWCRTIISIRNVLDSHSLWKTHSL